MVLTVAEVEGRLCEAVDTLKRLPVPDIQRGMTAWPEILRSASEAYGYNDVRTRLAPASAAAIDRLEETLQWLKWLPRKAQQILWSRAEGFSWRRIAKFVGKAPNTCKAWHLAGLHHIASRLNDKKKVAQSAHFRLSKSSRCGALLPRIHQSWPPIACRAAFIVAEKQPEPQWCPCGFPLDQCWREMKAARCIMIRSPDMEAKYGERYRAFLRRAPLWYVEIVSRLADSGSRGSL